MAANIQLAPQIPEQMTQVVQIEDIFIELCLSQCERSDENELKSQSACLSPSSRRRGRVLEQVYTNLELFELLSKRGGAVMGQTSSSLKCEIE